MDPFSFLLFVAGLAVGSSLGVAVCLLAREEANAAELRGGISLDRKGLQ